MGLIRDEESRHVVVSADDHGPLLAMATWFLVCTLVLCTAVRIGVRIATRTPRTLDDILILAAAVFAVGGTISGSFAVESGFGKRIALLKPSALETIQKEVYTTTILYVLTIGLSKLSINTFLDRLACTPNHKTCVVVLYAVIISWTFTFASGVMFQCELPRPWAVFNGKCINMLPFWIVAVTVDVLTDMAMVILPIRIVSTLQLPSRKKAAVISTFALRILLMILSVARVILLDRAMHGDLSFDSIPYAITTQAYSTTAVLVACLPGLKPFMDSVRTGMLSASLSKRSAGTTFGQGSWVVRPRITSNSTLWGSIIHERLSLATTYPAEVSKAIIEGQRHLPPYSMPKVATICPAAASIQVIEIPIRAASHKRPSNATTCPTEASIHVADVPMRLASYGRPSNAGVCPAAASIFVSEIQDRDPPRMKRSNSTTCPAEASQSFFEKQGQPKRRPKSVRPPEPALCTQGPARQLSTKTGERAEPLNPPEPALCTQGPVRQLSSAVRRETPPRPPPPPEELRPDLTCFQARLLGTNKTVVSCDNDNSNKKKRNERGREKRMGIITQTTQWEVKVEGGCV